MGNGALTLAARGKSLADSSALTTAVGGHSYTVEIDVEIEPGCECGMMLFYDPQHATGILLGPEGVGVRLANGYVPSRQQKGATRATLRVVNDRQEVDFYFRLPGKAVAAHAGIRRNLRNAAQRARRLPRCAAGDIRQRIRESYVAQLSLLAGGKGAGVGSALGTTHLTVQSPFDCSQDRLLSSLQGG